MALAVKGILLTVLLTVLMPGSARADTMVVTADPETAAAMAETPEMAAAAPETAAGVPVFAPDPAELAMSALVGPPLPVTLLATRGVLVDSTVRRALVVRDDSGTVWVRMPAQRRTGNPGLLDLDARQLSRNPDMAEATASRTINTIAEVADDYRFGRFASMMRTLNDGQQVTYTHLEEWHEQYIENYNIDMRRTRDEVLGGYLYVFGYQQSF